MSSVTLSHLLKQIEAGQSVRIEAPSADCDRLLSEAAASLGATARVVEVSSPTGPLGLSSLMAQLSERPDLDAQDDAVLERSFQRLAGSNEAAGKAKTVLLLNGSQGVLRSVFRYLQHVGRLAPNLVMVLAGGPELATAMADPGLAELWCRLAVLTPERAAESAPVPVAPQFVPEIMPQLAVLSLTQPRRRGLVWAASGLGMAASLALGAWIGHASAPTPRQPNPAEVVAAVPTRQAAAPTMPIELATVTAPVLAMMSPPERAAVPPPPPSMRAPKDVVFTRLAALPPAESSLANEQAALPLPRLPLGVAEATPQPVAGPGQSPARLPPLAAARPHNFRRYDKYRWGPGLAERRGWPPATQREPEPAQVDESARDEPALSPPRPPQPAAQPFIGTYSTDPYGTRTFRYEP